MKTTTRLLNAQEVATLVGCSLGTLNMWYRWKKLHADDERAKLIPEFTRENGGGRGAAGRRLWRYEDVTQLIEFRQSIVTGRSGFMGDITQKYVNKPNKKGE